MGPPDYAFDLEVPAGEQTLSANTPTEPYAFAKSTVNVSSDMKDVILTLNPAPVVTGRVSVAVWQEPESRKKYEGKALDINIGPRDAQTIKVGAITPEDVK